MPTKLYLISLSGQGDHQLTLVDEETWNWIGSAWPFKRGSTGGADPSIPANVKARLDPIDGDVYITSGSWENDRAIRAPTALFNGQPTPMFFSVKEMNRFVRDNDIEIVEEYDGCIY